MMSPDQCRAARALLGWSAQDLASAAGLGLATVKRFESGQLVQTVTVQALRNAVEAAGLVLIYPGDRSPSGGEGVRRATK
ncbi:helix-turn-helix domain-containing protein [Sphingomonas sp. Mn802worker]|uniref:helix-turn-helix domain-containing protein n=1 Tax=Sphingomonas sp. Mn802worker TaxID=629773 RepID=UPI000565E984